MANNIRHILVAIRDPGHAPRSLLLKAVTLAKASGARIELFHAINEPVALNAVRHGGRGHSEIQIMSAVATRKTQQLERLARRILASDPRVSCYAEWDHPPHEAVVRRALTIGADLVIASTQPPRLGGRLLLANTDWELIRHCPCPLLLVKSVRAYNRPKVIVAVDPYHASAKPAALDVRLLSAGAKWARLLNGATHVFHAYAPLVTTVSAAIGGTMPMWISPEGEREHTKAIKGAFDSFAKRARIPPARRHLRLGDVSGELAAVVKQIDADIVVMGAVSRSGLQRVFIGNTAERTLDRLTCDALIIKPRNFKTSVSTRMPLTL